MNEIGWNDDAITAWLDKLADCFGGYSQLPDETIGAALRGLVENGGFDRRLVDEAISRLASEIAGRWDDAADKEAVEWGWSPKFVIQKRIRRGFEFRRESS
jgi:hypothetical protein